MKKLFNLFRRKKPFNVEKALAGEPIIFDKRRVCNWHE
jgi:hypothetical protein